MPEVDEETLEIEDVPEEEEQEEAEVEEQSEEAEDEILSVQIGDEPPEEEEEDDGPDLVNRLRKRLRAETKARKEAEAKIAPVAEQKADTLGPKPTLESCDWDENAFEAALDDWKEKKRKADEQQKAEEEAQQQQQQRWTAKLEAHQEKVAALKAPDIDDAVEVVREALDPTQQALLIDVADNSALLGYALYKNPKKMAQLAAIKDYPAFVAALVRMEMTMKVSTGKSPPPPERGISGRTAGNAVDNTLDRLREKAAKTGDYSEVVRYKAQKKEKA